jgi:hypothetical protein
MLCSGAIHSQRTIMIVAHASPDQMGNSQHAYEVRPRKDKRGVDLIPDALPFSCLWCGEPNAIANAVDYPKFYSRSSHAAIRVYDAT